MRVPFYRYAFVKDNKLDYLTSKRYKEGKYKVFRPYGFNEANKSLLRGKLLKIIRTKDHVGKRITEWGVNYEVNALITTPNRKNLNLKTIWFVKANKRSPSFVTAYPV